MRRLIRRMRSWRPPYPNAQLAYRNGSHRAHSAGEAEPLMIRAKYSIPMRNANRANPKLQQPSLPLQGIYCRTPGDRHKVFYQQSALVSSHRPAEEPNSEALPRQRYGRDEGQCDTRIERYVTSRSSEVSVNKIVTFIQQ